MTGHRAPVRTDELGAGRCGAVIPDESAVGSAGLADEVRFEGLDVRVVWRPASGRNANGRAWPWVVSCGALALAVLASPPRSNDRTASHSPPTSPHLDSDAVRVLGWRGTAVPILVRTETIPNFGFHGVIPPAPAAPPPAAATTVEPRLADGVAGRSPPATVPPFTSAPVISPLPAKPSVLAPALKPSMEPTAPHRGHAVLQTSAAAKPADAPRQASVVMPPLPPGPPPPFATPPAQPTLPAPSPTPLEAVPQFERPATSELFAPEPPWGLTRITSTPPVVTPAALLAPVEPNVEATPRPVPRLAAAAAKPPEKQAPPAPKAKSKAKPERSPEPRPKVQSAFGKAPSWEDTAYKARN